ncbi:MAG: lysophospholipid acyltransferase family protein [Cyanobacteria bacterium P01_D01_bin.14]
MPLWGWAYRHHFRVQTHGWEHINHQQQMMLVGAHNGGLAAPDLPMFFYDWFRRVGYDHEIYGLMHAKVWQAYPDFAALATKFGAIPFYPRNALTVLQRGASVLVYPGGGQDAFRPHRLRDRICFHNRTGFIRLALWHALPIVPLISWGAHDTLIVLADCYSQAKRLHALGLPWPFGIDPEVLPIYLGLPWGLAVGPVPHIPWPVQMHTRVCPPITFERYGYEASRDKPYVQACYHQVVKTMQSALTALKQEVE